MPVTFNPDSVKETTTWAQEHFSVFVGEHSLSLHLPNAKVKNQPCKEKVRHQSHQKIYLKLSLSKMDREKEEMKSLFLSDTSLVYIPYLASVDITALGLWSIVLSDRKKCHNPPHPAIIYWLY